MCLVIISKLCIGQKLLFELNFVVAQNLFVLRLFYIVKAFYKHAESHISFP